jgi:hypothetical protein
VGNRSDGAELREICGDLSSRQQSAEELGLRGTFSVASLLPLDPLGSQRVPQIENSARANVT